jgi:hypothetical protein
VTLRTTIAAPFKHTRKSGMRKNELVYYYALDRKWMSTEQAFDLAGVTIPIGFKPGSSIFERNDPTQELIGRIAKAKNVEETAIVAEMNQVIKDGFDTHLLPPAALVILAKKYAVPFEDLRDALRQSLKAA